jgi:hypothetical protein
MVSPGRQEERVLARAAASVKDRASDQIGRFGNRPLWLSDVPGRFARIGGLKRAAIWKVAHAGL